jgi:hypothetical protein
MNQNFTKLSIFFVFIFQISCVRQRVITETYSDNTATIDKALNTWIGSSELDIITKFGTPDNSYTDNSGNKSIRFLGKAVQSTSGYIYNAN